MAGPRALRRLIGAIGLISFTTSFSFVVTAQDQAPAPDPRKEIIVHVQDVDSAPIRSFEYIKVGGNHTAVPRGPDGQLLEFTSVYDRDAQVRSLFHVGKYGTTCIVSAPGHVTGYHFFDPADVDEIVVSLEPAANVSGTITDSDGNPVAGALVWLGPVPFPGHHGRHGHIMESDADGRFASDRIPTGAVTFGVLHQDFITAEFTREVGLDQPNRLSFVLDGGASLTGVVLIGDQAPDEAYVQVSPVDRRWDRSDKQAQCDRAKFRLRGIVPGDKKVTIRAVQHQHGFRDLWWTAIENYRLAQGEEREIRTSIPSGTASFTGAILLEGKVPSDSVTVDIVLLYDDVFQRYLEVRTKANEEGGFALRNLTAGVWRLSVQLSNHERGETYEFRKRLDLNGGDPVRLILDFPLPQTL